LRDLKHNIRYYITGNVGILLLTWLLYAIGNSITMPYLSIYMKMLGANAFEIGIAYSIAMASQLITIIPGGYLTDTIGRRMSIVTGTWIITITSFLMAIAPNWQLLTVIYALNSAAAYYQPALLAIILDSLPPERYASGILVTSVLPQIPWLILPPVGGLLISRHGLLGIRIAYLISASISVIVAVIRQLSLRETLNNTLRKPSFRELLYSYYSLSRIMQTSREVFRIYVMALILAIALMPINTLLPIYVVYKLGLNTVYWGSLVSISYAAYIVLSIAITFYVDRFRSKLMIWGAVLGLIGSVVGLLENVPSVIVYLLLLQVGSQLLMTALQSRLGDLIGISRRGHGASLLIVFQLIGQMVGSYLSGSLYRLSTYTLFLIPLISISILLGLQLTERFNK